MKYVPLFVAGLMRKPSRTILTILSISIAFTLFGLMATVEDGFRRSIEKTNVNELRTNARFGSVPVPYSHKNEILRIEGIEGVAGRNGLFTQFQDAKNFVFVMGVDQDYFHVRSLLNATPDVIETLHTVPNGALVSAALAKRFGWSVGAEIPLDSTTSKADGSKTWYFKILAVVDDPNDPDVREFLITNYRHIDDERATGKGTAFEFFIRISSPAQSTIISKAIDAHFANSSAPTRTASERIVRERSLGALGDMSTIIQGVIAAVFFMLILITSTTMNQSMRERIPEFAVLKTLGFSNGFLITLILLETAVQCMVGSTAGLCVAAFVSPFIGSLPIRPELSASVVAQGLAAAAVVGALATLSPAWKLKRVPLATVLARA